MKDNKDVKQERSFLFKAIFVIVNVPLLVVFLVSMWKIGDYLLDRSKSSSFSRKIQNTAVIMDEEDEGEEESEESEIPKAVDFDKLHEISEDAVAWLYAPDTKINCVVAQSEDNDYYIHRLLDGRTADSGTLFADCYNSPDFSDWNTIIYGHNMKNGTMFKTLIYYRDPGYYEEHPVMYLYTPDHRYKLELVAGYTTSIYDRIYKVPATKQERDEMINSALRVSTFASGVTVGDEDRLVTLSTCSYDYEDARYVVIGRLVEE